MIKPAPPKSTGIAGLMLVFAVAASVGGMLFDVLDNSDSRVGLVAQPGAHAVLGVGIAALAIIAAHALRFVLARRTHDAPAAQGGADASHHA